MILVVATGAAVGQFAAGHRHKRTFRPLNDFQIPHNKTAVECDRAERLQSVVWVFHELDAHFGDVHARPPSRSSHAPSKVALLSHFRCATSIRR
jgi:hypothetical protein